MNSKVIEINGVWKINRPLALRRNDKKDCGSIEIKRKKPVTDGNSRPWFFIRKGKLYLMNTPDKPRKYIDISELGMDRDSITVSKVAGLQDCGYYYATATYRGRMYMVVTHNTESFGPLDIF